MEHRDTDFRYFLGRVHDSHSGEVIVMLCLPVFVNEGVTSVFLSTEEEKKV